MSNILDFSTLTVSFIPETEESEFADNLFIRADNDTIWAGWVKVGQDVQNGQIPQIVTIQGKAADSELKTKTDITVIVDTYHETVTIPAKSTDPTESDKLVICNYIRTDREDGISYDLTSDSAESDTIDKLDLLANLVEWYGSPESWDTAEKTAIWTYLAEVTKATQN